MDPDAERTGEHEILHRIFEHAPDATLLVDGSGQVLRANAQTERMFGYPREELVGQLVEILMPARFAARHPGHRAGYAAAPRTRPMGAGVGLFGRRRDGSEFPVDIMLSPVRTGGAPLVLAVVRDITERTRIEEQARKAREISIREIHHRVKNNLQVITSLLFLQSAHTKEPGALVVLEESRNRLRSIALIHEKLYKSSDLTRLGFAEYARDLVADLFRTYGVGQDTILVRIDAGGVQLDMDTAIPCGLIINELASNALKHAFPGGRRGVVSIELKPAGANEFVLVVADDGVGMPDGFDWRRSPTLGLSLMTDLTRQLDGEVELERVGGTRFRIRFRQTHYEDRS